MIYNTEQLSWSLKGQYAPLHLGMSNELDCWGLVGGAHPGVNTRVEW